MNISETIDKAFKLIIQFEGFRASPYYATAEEQKKGLLTIGYGFTTLDDRPVVASDTIDKQSANLILKAHIKEILSNNNVLPLCLNSNQSAAVCSLIFNIGMSNFKSSTLFKLLQAKEFGKASKEFLKWCHQAGKTLPGLVRRREAERLLFLS